MLIRTTVLSAALTATLAVVSLSLPAGSARAQDVQATPSATMRAEAPELIAMLEELGMYEIIALMATENTRGAADLEAQLFPGAGGAAWQATVTSLHSSDRMVALFEAAFDPDSISPEHIATVRRFLETDLGRRIIAGEVNTRRAFLDDDAVDAATEAFQSAVRAENPRLEILHRLNEINGLVDRNVSGALNLRYSFYRGLIEGGAFEDDVPEDLMLAEVWSQEPEVRQQTVEWLFSFQLAAYDDISDAELNSFADLMDTPAGRAVNGALFSAFDAMLGTLSYDLGHAAAGFIAGEDT